MALKVYSSGNYIITDTGTVMHEFAKGYTTYSYNQSTQIFTVRETVGGSFTVTRAQLLAGEIDNGAAVAYTFATFQTFLRENTGFKTATGGSVAAPIGAKLLKSGQTISYRNDDDGWLQEGRQTSFLALLGNNPYGNTKRFLDELGTEIFTNKIVIDWSTYDGSTVLGYRSTLSATAVTWNDAIDGAAAVSIATYTKGWRLPNLKELSNLTAFGITNPFDYSPINIPTGNQLWSSTTIHSFTNQAYYYDTFIGSILNNIKGSTYKYIAVRTFTVTGTTLT
jgi:hypothetical protein